MKKSTIPLTAETFFPRLCGLLFFLLLPASALAQSISVTTPIRTLPTTLTTPQFQIQPAPTQTADEMQWKDTTGAVVTWVDSNGILHFPGGGGGINDINGLTASTQYFVPCSLGLDFNIQDSIDTHSLCIPDASATARGLVTIGAQVIGGEKTFTGSTLIDNDLYVTGHFSTDHPIEITGEACGTAEANVGLFGFDPVTGLPCWSYDGSTPGPFPFPTLNQILNPTGNTLLDLTTFGFALKVGNSQLSIPAASGGEVNLYVEAPIGPAFFVEFAATANSDAWAIQGKAGCLGVATCPSAAALYADDNYKDVGATITNNYGLFVASQTEGDTNYSIYTDGPAPSHFSGPVDAFRFKSSGTALVAGDFTPTGWGGGAAVGTVSGTDQWFKFTVTAGTVPSANPTVALTYKDGTWTTAPIPICNINGGTGAISFTPATSTATVLTLTYVGTPVNALTYIIACHVGGI